jgi:hypothetical protein
MDFVLHFQFARLISHMMSPSSAVSQRLFVMNVLMNEPAIADVFKHTLGIKGMVSDVPVGC